MQQHSLTWFRAALFSLLLTAIATVTVTAQEQRPPPSKKQTFRERTLANVRLMQKVLVVVPKDQALKMMRKQLEAYGQEDIMDRYPGLFSYFIDILKHPTAVPNLIIELGNFRRLSIYFICFIVLSVIGFFLKRKNRRRQASWPRRFAVGTFLNLAFMACNIACFYMVFRRELSPFIELSPL